MTQRPYNPSQGAPGGPTGGVPRPAPHAPFNPTADTATYRDLLLFEERLKMNAEMLARRRRRYNAFLWSFVLALVWLLHRWMFIPPDSLLTMRAVQASIAVVVITLVLFFASGMYEEKIRYAHSYITHSNKALRPLNMHLNLRRPPATFPIPFFRSKVTVPSAAPPAPAKSLASRRQSTTSTVMASIPPSHNPRGELIFSSRVDKMFREGYERYRAAFERRREEKAREEARRNARWFSGVGASRTPTTSTPTPPASRRGTPPPSLGAAGGEKALAETRRGRTPSPGMIAGSRLRHSVDMGGFAEAGNGTMSGNDAGGGNGGAGGSGYGSGSGSGKEGKQEIKRERAESYSFVWSDGGPKRAP